MISPRLSTLLLALMLLSAPADAQGGDGGLPRPPTPAEVAEVPAETRLRQQSALKAVWLERLIRARGERHRVSRENAAAAVLQAQSLGAPAAFVAMLRRQAVGNLSPRERHVLDSSQLALLSAYGVDAREMRFFVEGSTLSVEQLRDVVAWLPLEALFNAFPAEEAITAEAASRAYGEFLAVRRELAAALQPVSDLASADAAAASLLPALQRYHAALRVLLQTPPAVRAAALAPHAREEAAVNAAADSALSRLRENGWFGSYRLETLVELLH